MLFLNFSYFLLLRFFIFCIFFIFILFFLCSTLAPFITTKNKSVLTKNYALNKNKKSAYECGFEPFNDSRGSFEVHFHITAIMFLLFDIEVAYLLPWLLNLKNLGSYGFWCGFVFFAILLVGFIYELKRGALDWPKDSN